MFCVIDALKSGYVDCHNRLHYANNCGHLVANKATEVVLLQWLVVIEIVVKSTTEAN